jgi:hypothetical protein
MGLAKDPSILALLDRLDLSAHNWLIVDHWDADECAIGIARADQPRRLVYISTFETGPDRYAYDCEEPNGVEETGHVVVDRGVVSGMSALEAVLRRHLDEPAPQRTHPSAANGEP